MRRILRTGIAATFLLVFLSLGLGGVSTHPLTTPSSELVIAPAAIVVTDCNEYSIHHPCGPSAPECAMTCPAQAFLLTVVDMRLDLPDVSMIDYPVVTDIARGFATAPKPYPPRTITID